MTRIMLINLLRLPVLGGEKLQLILYKRVMFSIKMGDEVRAISLHEVATAYITEEFHLTRRRGTLIISGSILVFGLLCSLSFGPLSGIRIFGRNIFSMFDDLSGMVLLPLGGMFISIFAGWKLDRQLYRDEISNGGDLRTPYFKALIFALRYIAPLAIGLVFLDQQGLFNFL